MNERGWTPFDIDGLAARLTSRLANPDDSIDTTDFVEKVPRKNPFLNKIDDWEAYKTTKCNLVWTAHGRGLMAIAGLPKEINLGYAFLEEGYTDASSDYNGYYEALKIRLKHPLELRNGLVIPPCSIKMTHEVAECCSGETARKDHVRRFGLFWQKADLSELLPTSWFLRAQAPIAEKASPIAEQRTAPAY